MFGCDSWTPPTALVPLRSPLPSARKRLPIVQCKPSLLSGEASSQNYRGLLNLMAILLLVANLRLIASNIREYGLSKVVPRIHTPSDFANAPRLTGTLSLVSNSSMEASTGSWKRGGWGGGGAARPCPRGRPL